jgi:WD40 repeat protein
MIAIPGASAGIVRALVVMLLGVGLAVPAHATEPPAEPILRIAAGMHGAPIWRISVDAASRYVVTSSWDKTVGVWDLKSGQLVRMLRPAVGSANEAKLYAVSMSPDGVHVACAGWTGVEWDRTVSIYIFDRATGALTRRIPGFPDVIGALAYSPDGRFLAVGLFGTQGLRLVRADDGTEVGADRAYGNQIHGLDFDRSGHLVTTSIDGALRLYQVTATGLTLVAKQQLAGPGLPYLARFSPDGSRIAVGYDRAARVDVFSSPTLTKSYSPDTRDVTIGDFGKVAWSSDGRLLYAGGQYAAREGNKIRVWEQGGQGRFTDFLASKGTVMDIAQLRGGGVVYGAGDPLLGAVDAAGRKIFERHGPLADFRNGIAAFKVSREGTSVQFPFEVYGNAVARFDIAERRLLVDAPPDQNVAGPVVNASGLDIKDWLDSYKPTLNGLELKLEQYEMSRAFAIAPDRSFVLAADWSLRRFDAQGRQLWAIPMPNITWAVNVSGDGKTVVAAHSDGTVRWYRLTDGQEILALFPHSDRKRWVLWSSSGYYDASPGAEDLIGWHVNRGKDKAADFYPASRFRSTFYRPDVVAKVLESQDEAVTVKRVNDEAGRKTQTVNVVRALPPVVEIVAPAEGTAVSTPEVRIRFTVRTAADAPVTGVRSRVNGQSVTLGALTAGPAEREVTVPIPSQDSDIMLFAENRHGVSVPAVVHVTWRGTPSATASENFDTRPKLYLLAVGVSAYQDRTLTLQYPAKDARDFAQAMQQQKGGLYRDVEIKLLTDLQATRDNVTDGLEWLQRQVTAKDIGMLFLAGHGVNDPNGIYYFLPANFNVDALKRTGLPFSDIKNTLASLAGKSVFFVDTCHSGNVMGGRRAPVDLTGVVNELASAENGVVVFASSTGRQYSMESAEWSNGAFTKALVEGVTGRADVSKTGRITHKMLDFYLAERVKQLTKGQQTPVNTSPQGVPDFPIALTPGAKR